MTIRATVVIPARVSSKRLPGKILLSETGTPLIQYVVRAARACRLVEHVVVATDSMAVARAVNAEAVCWVDLHDHSWCGSQRAARALHRLPSNYRHVDVCVNWQADEPEVQSEDVDLLIRRATELTPRHADVLTLVAPHRPGAARQPTVVKAVFRRPSATTVQDFVRLVPHSDVCHRPHVGIYAMRPERMEQLCEMHPTVRSIGESLEQLTWTDNGWRIKAVAIGYEPIGINTRRDYETFVARQMHRDSERDCESGP